MKKLFCFVCIFDMCCKAVYTNCGNKKLRRIIRTTNGLRLNWVLNRKLKIDASGRRANTEALGAQTTDPDRRERKRGKIHELIEAIGQTSQSIRSVVTSPHTPGRQRVCCMVISTRRMGGSILCALTEEQTQQPSPLSDQDERVPPEACRQIRSSRPCTQRNPSAPRRQDAVNSISNRKMCFRFIFFW